MDSSSNEQTLSNANLMIGGGLLIVRISTRCCRDIDLTPKANQIMHSTNNRQESKQRIWEEYKKEKKQQHTKREKKRKI